jgi:flavin-dependent dehydrogenase
MPKKSGNHPEILVWGSHISAYLASALLQSRSKMPVIHAVPGPTGSAAASAPAKSAAGQDRLVLVNPALFDLHPLAARLRRRVEFTPIYGAQFLGNDTTLRGESRGIAAVALVASLAELTDAMAAIAGREGVQIVPAASVRIGRLDETGIELKAGSVTAKPRAAIVADAPTPDVRRALGLPGGWEPDVLYRYSYARLKRGVYQAAGAKPIISMSLDLCGPNCWAWLLHHGDQAQLAVMQPIDGGAADLAGAKPAGGAAAQPSGATPASGVGPNDLMARWVAVLRRHGVIGSAPPDPLETIHGLDMPLAGALSHEEIANRTLLIGPAAGFYSPCAEDVYPNCWSAMFAVDVLEKSRGERHLQDAIQSYRHIWRTTLGEYLRGPRQHLRFLLPLVYRNQVMTDRLADSILAGKSIVR